eukprot:CAMPEP_0194140006 /NCGR_PEP_ID=MMETSP0152-20130528/9602_1 /TAXON_ID=1049557 /ORGANISM="Thalassiothrix antarctica, Strain L6-D1" /LENGTH=141 /DNA_ID=CAMNT_0038838063 /DNA_START=48 /DNA_END=473 /DNA_ORIENTATION=+
MQFRVLIPSHITAGQLIRIRCPDGTEGEVKVPNGLKSGDSFVFEMPESPTSSSTSITSTPSSSDKGFLDREIVNLQDFVMALAVGLLIGLSIVAGFLLGVLVVTAPQSTTGGSATTTTNPMQAEPGMQQIPQMRMPKNGEL